MTKTTRTALGLAGAVLLAAGCTVSGTGAVTPGASSMPSTAPSASGTTSPAPSASPSGNAQTPPQQTSAPSQSASPLPCTVVEQRAASLFAATFPATATANTDFDVKTWVYLDQTPSVAIEAIAATDPFSYTVEDASKTIRIKGRVDAAVPNPANPECAFTMQAGGKAEEATVKVKVPAGTWKVVLENFKAELPLPQDGAPAPAQPTATITVQ